MQITRCLICFVALLWAAAWPAGANINLQNGNFYIGYTDVSHGGAQTLKLERVYNSKTTFKGIFGWGWGSDYEAYLQIEADGSVTYHEYGGGADNRFYPPEMSVQQLEETIESLVKAARATGNLTDADAIARYRLRAAREAEFRSDEWEKYRARGLLEAPQAPIGTRFRSTRFGARTLARTANGYLMKSETSANNEWHFDQAGHLITVREGAHRVECRYNSRGQLAVLDDGRRIELIYDGQGRVSEARDGEGRRSIYRYNDSDELIYNRDTDEIPFEYFYSADGRHKLIEILNKDGTSLKLSYYPASIYENVRSIEERDGTHREYSYGFDPHDENHSHVWVKVSDENGYALSSSSYEYFHKVTPEGVKWLARIRTDLDGEKSDTAYNRDSLPLHISRDGQETFYRYDALNRTIYRRDAEAIVEYEYDAASGKISRMTRAVLSAAGDPPAEKTWVRYEYDAKGELRSAENSVGKKISLEHDDKGRIAVLVDESGRVELSYNAKGNIAQITAILPQGATTTVKFEYDAQGKSKPLDADADKSALFAHLRISQALLELTRVARVEY